VNDQSALRGIVHGKTIELDQDAGLPEGQPVTVVVQPLGDKLAPGEGLKRSFGGWSDDADNLDEYLEWSRQQRKTSRSGIDQ
jgi:hypothetical protein